MCQVLLPPWSRQGGALISGCVQAAEAGSEAAEAAVGAGGAVGAGEATLAEAMRPEAALCASAAPVAPVRVPISAIIEELKPSVEAACYCLLQASNVTVMSR